MDTSKKTLNNANSKLIFQAYSAINNKNNEKLKELLEQDKGLLDFSNSSGENLFLYACKKDNLEAVKFLLLKKEKYILSKNNKNQNFIQILLLNNSEKTVLDLISNFPDEYKGFLKEVDDFGNIAAFYAAESNKTEIIEKIIEFSNESILEKKNKFNNNLFHFLVKNKLIDFKNLNIVFDRKLLEQSEVNFDMNPIMLAASYQSLANFKTIYNNKNYTNALGNDLLSCSLKNKDREVIGFLMQEFKDKLNYKFIELIFDFKNDDALVKALELKPELFNSGLIKKIFQHAEYFKSSIAYLGSKRKEFNINNDLLITYFRSNKISDIDMSILTDTISDDSLLVSLIDNVIKAKTEFMIKIGFLFLIRKNISDENVEKIIKKIETLPLNQQFFILKMSGFKNALSAEKKLEINKLINFKEKRIVSGTIPDYLVRLFCKTATTEEEFTNIYNNSNSKIFVKNVGIKSLDEIKKVSFLKQEEKEKILFNYFMPILIDKKNKEMFSKEEVEFVFGNNDFLKKMVNAKLIKLIKSNKKINLLNKDILKIVKEIKVDPGLLRQWFLLNHFNEQEWTQLISNKFDSALEVFVEKNRFSSQLDNLFGLCVKMASKNELEILLLNKINFNTDEVKNLEKKFGQKAVCDLAAKYGVIDILKENILYDNFEVLRFSNNKWGDDYFEKVVSLLFSLSEKQNINALNIVFQKVISEFDNSSLLQLINLENKWIKDVRNELIIEFLGKLSHQSILSSDLLKDKDVFDFLNIKNDKNLFLEVIKLKNFNDLSDGSRSGFNYVALTSEVSGNNYKKKSGTKKI